MIGYDITKTTLGLTKDKMMKKSNLKSSNTINLVERHIINPSDTRFSQMMQLCHLSKNLYNALHFIQLKSTISRPVSI